MKKARILAKILMVTLCFVSLISTAAFSASEGGAGSSGGGTAEAALFRTRGDELLTALIKGRAIVTTAVLAASFSSQITDSFKSSITEDYIAAFREALETSIQGTTNRIIYDESQEKVIDEKSDQTGMEKGEMYVTVPSPQIHFLLFSLPYWKDLSKKQDIEGQYALVLHAYSRAMSAKMKKYENAAYGSTKILALLKKMSLLDLKASERIRYVKNPGTGSGCEKDYSDSIKSLDMNTKDWTAGSFLSVGILSPAAVTSTVTNNKLIEDRTKVLSVIEQAKLGKGIDLIRFGHKLEFNHDRDAKVGLEKLSDVIVDMNSARVICPQGRELLSYEEFYSLIRPEIFP